MTTDITELAQREKFEAWAEERCALPWGYLKNRRTNTGYFSKHDYTSLWAAWKAAGAELVEALEKAQTINAAAEKLVRCKGRYHSEQNYRALAALFGVNTPDLPPLEHENVHYADAADMEIAALRQRIAELESRTLKLPDGWQFEECEIEGCENGAIFSVGTGSRNIHLCDKCAHEPENSRLKKSPLSKRLPFKMSAGIKVEAE
ncbi:TPA: hypothetical protein ACW70F_005943 [Klebsiella michiganensis]